MKTINNESLTLPTEVLADLGNGETYALTNAHEVLAFIVPAQNPTSKRPIGLAKGEFSVPDDFNDPLPEVEAGFYGE